MRKLRRDRDPLDDAPGSRLGRSLELDLVRQRRRLFQGLDDLGRGVVACNRLDRRGLLAILPNGLSLVEGAEVRLNVTSGRRNLKVAVGSLDNLGVDGNARLVWRVLRYVNGKVGRVCETR